MSTLKSNNEDMTINADGASSEVKFQANGVEKASISAAGAVTSTTIDATALTGNLPAIDGSSLTGVEGVPSGCILMWSGAITAIPSGWVICDGNNSTPNLTDRFVIHADADSGGTNDVGDTGGSATTGSHTLSTSEMPSHNHSYQNAGQVAAWGANGVNARNTTNVNLWTVYTASTGGGGSHTHTATPKYYALAFIMKS